MLVELLPLRQSQVIGLKRRSGALLFLRHDLRCQGRLGREFLILGRAVGRDAGLKLRALHREAHVGQAVLRGQRLFGGTELFGLGALDALGFLRREPRILAGRSAGMGRGGALAQASVNLLDAVDGAPGFLDLALGLRLEIAVLVGLVLALGVRYGSLCRALRIDIEHRLAAEFGRVPGRALALGDVLQCGQTLISATA